MSDEPKKNAPAQCQGKTANKLNKSIYIVGNIAKMSSVITKYHISRGTQQSM